MSRAVRVMVGVGPSKNPSRGTRGGRKTTRRAAGLRHLQDQIIAVAIQIENQSETAPLFPSMKQSERYPSIHDLRTRLCYEWEPTFQRALTILTGKLGEQKRR